MIIAKSILISDVLYAFLQALSYFHLNQSNNADFYQVNTLTGQYSRYYQ